jgi:osmotically-inducible protein OsmY
VYRCDDATLAQKVMTELFRDPHVPKDAINVNAESGVVLLCGEIEEPAMMHLPGDSVPRS